MYGRPKKGKASGPLSSQWELQVSIPATPALLMGGDNTVIPKCMVTPDSASTADLHHYYAVSQTQSYASLPLSPKQQSFSPYSREYCVAPQKLDAKFGIGHDIQPSGTRASQQIRAKSSSRPQTQFHPYGRPFSAKPLSLPAAYLTQWKPLQGTASAHISQLPGVINPDYNACGGGLLSCPLLNFEKSSADVNSTQSNAYNASSWNVRAPKSPFPFALTSDVSTEILSNYSNKTTNQEVLLDATDAERLVAPKSRDACNLRATTLLCMPAMHRRDFAGRILGQCPPILVPTSSATAHHGASPTSIPVSLQHAFPANFYADDFQPFSLRLFINGMPVERVVELSGNPKRRFVALRKLGKGGCGEVYLGQEIHQSTGALLPKLVALKFVSKRREFRAEHSVLEALRTHYRALPVTQTSSIPSILVGVNKRRKVLVLEYLSESLAQQFEKCKFRFSLKTVLLLSIRMIELVSKFYYQSGYVHVDVKPSNFCTGQKGTDLQLIDFGYSSLPGARLPGPTGTPLFMSISIQTMASTSPTLQDDLESIGYVIMFFIAGGRQGLPWGQNNTHQSIAVKKGSDYIEAFCEALKSTEYAPLTCALQTYLALVRDRENAFEPLVLVPRLLSLFAQVLMHCNWLDPTHLHQWSTVANKFIQQTMSLANVPPIALPEFDYDWLHQPVSPPLSGTVNAEFY